MCVNCDMSKGCCVCEYMVLNTEKHGLCLGLFKTQKTRVYHLGSRMSKLVQPKRLTVVRGDRGRTSSKAV